MKSIFNRALALVAVFSMLLLTGCERERLLPLSRSDTILAFGDSLTEGYGVSPSQSYPVVLEQMSGLRVVNAGVSGEISQRGLERLPQLLDQHRPGLVILMHGGNDILQNRSSETLKQNLAAMIELIRARSVQIVLVGVPEKNLFSDSAPLYAELADQYELAFEEQLIGDLIRSPAMKSDSVHFNAKGYRQVAQAIHEVLDQHGAI